DDGSLRTPDYLAINPMGKVPALRHNRTVVTEAAAICCYLADTFPRARLNVPLDDPRRGPYLKWLFFGPSCFEPSVIEAVYKREPGNRGTLGWGNFELVLEVLENALAKGPYILGEQFSAADIVIGSGLRWGMMTKNVPVRPAFFAYAERLAERPA